MDKRNENPVKNFSWGGTDGLPTAKYPPVQFEERETPPTEAITK